MARLKVVFAAPDGQGTATMNQPVTTESEGSFLVFRDPGDGEILLVVSESSFYYAAKEEQ
jgi:hypothetical protein